MNKGRAAKSMEEEQTQKDSYNRPNKTRSFIDPLFLSQFDSQSLSCTNSKSLWGWLNLNPSPINISILKKVKKKKLYICICKKNNHHVCSSMHYKFIHYGSVITVILTVTFFFLSSFMSTVERSERSYCCC